MKHNSTLKALFISNGIFSFAGSFLGPLYAVYIQHLGNGILTISATWAVGLLSTILFTIVISRFQDRRVNREHFLIIGFLIRAIVWAGFAIIHTTTELVVLQILLGMGGAIGSPAFDALFAEHLDKNKHIQEFADWSVISNIVTAIGTLVGGIMVASMGFKPLFIGMSLLAFFSALLMHFRTYLFSRE